MQETGAIGRPIPERWLMLPLLMLSFIGATLNWFNIVGAFGFINPTFRIGVAQDGLLVGVFLAGYGVFNILGGVFANRVGFRKTLLLGFVVESAGSMLTACSPNYPLMVGARFLSGVGASFIVGVSFALTNVWFKDAEINLANGLVGGAGFNIGAAVVLQFGATLSAALGWRQYLFATGVVGFLIAATVILLVKTPAHEQRLSGGRITREDLREVFLNKPLWLLGVSMIGSYGSYFTTSELIGRYAVDVLHFGAGPAAAAGTTVLLTGIPGSIVGGLLTDIVRRVKAVYGLFQLVVASSFFSIMVHPCTTVWLIAATVGFFFTAAFAAYTATPGILGTISPQNLALAAGFLLSIAALGGFSVPAIFGILASTSYLYGWVFLGCASMLFLISLPFMEEPFRTSGG